MTSPLNIAAETSCIATINVKRQGKIKITNTKNGLGKIIETSFFL